MVTTTVVHCHGLLGKDYIIIIKPFHVLIVKYSLASVPERITSNVHHSQNIAADTIMFSVHLGFSQPLNSSQN
jgi:hypothetical protein